MAPAAIQRCATSSQRRHLRKKEQDRITAPLETIAHRIAAHHGHYADARSNLDDSLELLSNVTDI